MSRRLRPAELYAQDAIPEDDPPRKPFVIEWWSVDGGGGPSAGGGEPPLGTVIGKALDPHVEGSAVIRMMVVMQ